MFAVEIRDTEYKVDFLHYSGKERKKPLKVRSYLKYPGTFCQITNVDSQVVVATGKTELSVNDQYCKNFGRKLSLKRALDKTGFTKDNRIQFWNAYKEVRGRLE